MNTFRILEGVGVWPIALSLLQGFDANKVFPPPFQLQDCDTGMVGQCALDITRCIRCDVDRYDIFQISGFLFWAPTSKLSMRGSSKEGHPFEASYNLLTHKGELWIEGDKLDFDWVMKLNVPRARP